MTKTIRQLTSILVLVFLSAGCQTPPATEESVPEQIKATDLAARDPQAVEAVRQRAIYMRNQVKAAILELSGRIEVEPGEIELVRAVAVNWSDGSLGCPVKGISYTQALVPGTLIVLSDGSREFEYHATIDGEPMYCAKPQPPANFKTLD